MKNKEPDIFLTLLLVLFIGLKLSGVIEWSWWWIFSPVWIPVLLVIIVVLIAFIIEYISEKN